MDELTSSFSLQLQKPPNRCSSVGMAGLVGIYSSGRPFNILFVVSVLSIFVFTPHESAGVREFRFCQKNTSFRAIQIAGKSMAGWMNPGKRYLAELGPSHCMRVDLETPVLFRNNKNQLLVKAVKALPGDHILLARTENHFEMIVNGRPIRTTKGQLLRLSPPRAEVIKKEISNFMDYIPEGKLLVMGNHVGGTYDSSRFGLLPKKAVLGIVHEE
jgi:signal peptidase I